MFLAGIERDQWHEKGRPTVTNSVTWKPGNEMIPYNILKRLETNRELLSYKWDKVFKSGPSKVCGRQPLKKIKLNF